MEPLYSIAFPEPSGPPQLTTFYSFKGGVGRTQSLHNVGARLAALRRKVLMVDVDLEAPGLSIGALPDRVRKSKDGFAEIASDLLFELDVALDEDPDFFADVIEEYQTRIDGALHVVDVPVEPRSAGLADRLREDVNVTNLPTGSLALLATGRIDPDYPQKMIDVRIDEAFEHELSDDQKDRLPNLLDAAGLPTLAGTPDTLGLVFTAVLRHLLRGATDPSTGGEFQHVLIDSRSGLADVGGLCLRGLADTRVVLSGLNKQNLEGTRMVLNTLSEEERGNEQLIVVFSPVPEGEVQLVEERLSHARERLDANEEQTHLLHYHPRIALTEDPFAEPIHEHTRIYDEYEALTDRLLALTQSDARTLVADALDRFRESGPDEEDADENRYERLVSELIPAAFLDEDHVESIVDGLCSQMGRSGPYETKILVLFDLWTALARDEERVLGATANYYGEVGRKNALELNETQVESLFETAFDLYERATDQNPREARIWYNWGTDLGNFIELVQDDKSERAESFYLDASDKFERAVDIKSDKHDAWNNWGTNLGKLADFIRNNEPKRAESLYLDAFDKFERAVELKPDAHNAWYNWGLARASLAELIRNNEPKRAESLYLDAFDKFERTVDIKSDKHDAWNNWGTNLGKLAGLVQHDDPDRAESLYLNASDKYERAVDLNPDKHEAWFNWGTDLANLAGLVQHDDPDRAESLFLDAFDKFERAVDIKLNMHEAWFNWGNNLSKLADLVQDDEPERAESLYLDAADKFERAVDIKPDEPETWGNWGINLVQWGRLCYASGDENQADAALSEAIKKLEASFEHGFTLPNALWLIVAYAERGQDGDIEAAAELLESLLDNSPKLVYAFDIDDAAAVREQPELRAILDRYRAQADVKADVVEDIDDLDADLDSMPHADGS